jgi:hypothetical protein
MFTNFSETPRIMYDKQIYLPSSVVIFSWEGIFCNSLLPYNSPSVDPILSQIHSDRNLASYLFKIHFNIFPYLDPPSAPFSPY